ncbi:MAG: winged helix-turn-helix transcriptional regulator [Deltaproteobacteria bacterium]|nr:winged helix-turn-helix transcriptional regulator [Deltaproteobacteria bacterium]
MPPEDPPRMAARAGSGDWIAEALLLRAIAHPVRLQILEALSVRSHCVKDLNALIPALPQPQLSQHMRALRRVGLVASHKDGPLRCYYILRPSLVPHLLDLLSTRHPEQPREKADVRREALGEASSTRSNAQGAL